MACRLRGISRHLFHDLLGVKWLVDSLFSMQLYLTPKMMRFLELSSVDTSEFGLYKFCIECFGSFVCG